MTLLCFQLHLLYLSPPCILLNSSLFPISVCFHFSVWSPFYSAAWLMLSSRSLSTLVCQVIAITVQNRPLLSLNLRRRGSRKILLSNFKPIQHSQWPPTLCELWWILILKLGVMRGKKVPGLSIHEGQALKTLTDCSAGSDCILRNSVCECVSAGDELEKVACFGGIRSAIYRQHSEIHNANDTLRNKPSHMVQTECPCLLTCVSK